MLNTWVWKLIQVLVGNIIVYDLSIQLSRANALLFKMRKYVSHKILISFYFTIFDSYLSYCCLTWAQNLITIQWNFQSRDFRISPLFKQSSILKFQEKIFSENVLLVSKSNNLSPSDFNAWFSFSSDQHNCETSSSTQGNLIKHFYKTNRWEAYIQ